MKFNKKWLWLIVPILIFSLVYINSSSVSTVLLAIQGAITGGNLVKFSGTNGIGVDTGLSATNVVKCKFDATSAPTVNDDASEGYTVGSGWYDINNGKSYICFDSSGGAAVWIEIAAVDDGITTFTALTDTPANYDGQAGRYTRVNAGETALEFGTPVGAGDMEKSTYDTDEDGDIDVAAGGTEKSLWTQYAIPYLSGTAAFGEIPIGTAEYALTVNATATGYDFTLFDLTLYYLKTEIDSFSELQAIIADKTLVNVEDGITATAIQDNLILKAVSPTLTLGYLPS
ncbi:hypothetical protein ES708_25802 [subsurface metagenome]